MRYLWLTLLFAGCGSLVAGPSGYEASIVAIAECDPVERPELPDDLDSHEDVGAVAKADRPVVQVFISQHHCPPCDEAKRDLPDSGIPYKIMPKNPDWVAERGYPSFAVRTKDGWAYLFGWPGLARFRDWYEGAIK